MYLHISVIITQNQNVLNSNVSFKKLTLTLIIKNRTQLSQIRRNIQKATCFLQSNFCHSKLSLHISTNLPLVYNPFRPMSSFYTP